MLHDTCLEVVVVMVVGGDCSRRRNYLWGGGDWQTSLQNIASPSGALLGQKFAITEGFL